MKDAAGRERPRPTDHQPASTISLRREEWRRWRAARWARQRLDEMLGPALDPWDFAADPIDYHLVHLDRTIGERHALGADLAAAGWCPP